MFVRLLCLVVIVFAGSPEFDLTNMVPDRTVSRFYVQLNLYCGRIGHSNPFDCSIQLRESNWFIDEPITRTVDVSHNTTNTLEVQLRGSMYQYPEPSPSFEPYIRFKCSCILENETTHYQSKDLKLDECLKEKKVCSYELDVDVADII